MGMALRDLLPGECVTKRKEKGGKYLQGFRLGKPKMRVLLGLNTEPFPGMAILLKVPERRQ